jgi:hypothetical protein
MRKLSANLAIAVSLFLVFAVSVLSVTAQNSSITQNNNPTGGNVVEPVQAGTASDEKNELSVQGGFAPDIPRVFGGSRKSTFGFAAVRYSRHLIGSENVALKYTIDFIPVAVINYEQQQIVQTAPTTFITQRNDKTVYGFGLTPVGFQLNFRRQKKVQPFLTASAGLIRFTKTIPDDRSPVRPNQFGRQLNYTLAGGGGVEFLMDSGKSFTAGFKFHHISNASTGNINPGFDQNLFYIGYTFKKW